MNKLMKFIVGPAVAGVVFALAVLILPSVIAYLPGVSRLLPHYAGQEDIAAGLSYSAAIKKAAPAVVSINSQQQISRWVERYGVNWVGESNSLGSGVIISADGYVITSYHIFFSPGTTTHSEDTTITLNDGRTLEARRLVMDEENDLALLKVDAENLPYIRTGSARQMDVGDVVLAIGNPRNIGQSVSLGIVSALLRRDDSFMIQTDAAINPGNSGGALIDVHGNLIGINSSIVSESGGSEGIGFATPVSKAIALMSNYIESGPSGYLGVDSELIRMQAGGQTLEGFHVIRVPANSPADKAGIRAGDIITALDDTRVDFDNRGAQFIKQLSGHSPGDTVQIEVYRDGTYRTLSTVLGVGEPVVYPFFESEQRREQEQRTIN